MAVGRATRGTGSRWSRGGARGNGPTYRALRFSTLLALALVSAAALVGCRGCSDSERGSREPCPALAPAAPWLVLKAVDQQRGRLRLLALDASGPTPRAFPPKEMAAEPVANWPGHYQAVVAHAGPLAVAATPTEGGAAAGQLALMRLDDDAARRPPLALGPLHPTAIHLLGEHRAVVGAPAGLATVELGAEVASAVPLDALDGAAPPRPQGDCSFGLLARSGAVLVAIAERETPPWAEALEIDCEGRARRHTAGALPSLANGSYTEALVDGAELLLVAHYAEAEGTGHLVARLGLERLSDPELGNLVLNGPVAGRPPLVEEFEPDPNEHERPRRLLAGSQFTPWAGLGAVGDHLLVGAGDRGVLVLARRFGGEEQATRLEVGGRCLDVTSRGDAAYALVETAERTVVRTLAFDRARDRFMLVGEAAVEGRWESFVR